MLTLKFGLHCETTFPQCLVDDAPSQGQFDSYAEEILTRYDVQVSLADSIAYLKRLGAWELSELQDLELNKMRLVWIALLDCKDNGTRYWYMGE
jgi:hypothetical protein